MTHESPWSMVAKCARELEPALAEEITACGGVNIAVSSRGVAFEGGRETLYRVNLASRLASSVLLRLFTASAPSLEAVQETLRGYDWTRHFDVNHTFCVDGRVSDSIFTHSHYGALVVKDAVADVFRERVGQRPSVDTRRPDVRIEALFRNNEMTVFLNASGAPLHERGYRQKAGPAPLRETLAAGILRLTEWDESEWLLDPMCGSGVFGIEGAMMATGRAPGAKRSFGFMKWRDYDGPLFDRLRQEAADGARPLSEALRIHCSDVDPAVVASARENARRAGVDGGIAFDTGDFFDFQPPADGPGVVVMNPPYGQRMALEQRREFYGLLGDTLKQRYAGYRVFILTGDLQAHKMIGLKPTMKLPLSNGGMECRLLAYRVYSGSHRQRYQSDPPPSPAPPPAAPPAPME